MSVQINARMLEEAQSHVEQPQPAGPLAVVVAAEGAAQQSAQCGHVGAAPGAPNIWFNILFLDLN